jgi:DNA-binding transcriptional LysR family regulator
VIPVQGRYQADNSEGVREGVLGGLGIGVIPIWLFNDDEITRGAVRIILRDFEPTSLPIHAVYPSRRLVPTKVRAMIEFLAAEFGLNPLLSDRGFSHAALSNSRTLPHGSG